MAKVGSGGARIIYYFLATGDVIYLLDVYAKGEKEDLTDDDKTEIRKFIEALKA